MNFRKAGNIVLVLNILHGFSLHYIESNYQTDLCKNNAIIFHFVSSSLITYTSVVIKFYKGFM